MTRPTPPTGLNTVATGSNEIVGWWTASSDNWGVYGYWINRREAGTQDPPTKFGTNQTWFVHDDVEPGTSYEYWVEAIDLCPRLSDPSAVQIVTTPSP